MTFDSCKNTQKIRSSNSGNRNLNYNTQEEYSKNKDIFLDENKTSQNINKNLKRKKELLNKAKNKMKINTDTSNYISFLYYDHFVRKRRLSEELEKRKIINNKKEMNGCSFTPKILSTKNFPVQFK